MNINRHNCEAWFLDYYENNLNSNQVAELFAFLDANPDLQEIFTSYEGAAFEEDSLNMPTFEGKDLLKKQIDIPTGINAINYEEYFIAHIEGLLDSKEEQELEKFLSNHTDKKAELELFLATQFQPDASIVFEEKNALKKELPAITAANFDEFAVAALEGELSREEQIRFDQFLIDHPQYRADYELFAQTKFTPETTILFEQKDLLKKQETSINAGNFDEFAVAALDHELNAAQQAEFDAFVESNPLFQKEYELLSLTKLTPETDLVFEEKAALKKHEVEITAANFDYYAVRSIEVELNSIETTAFQTFLAANPIQQKAYTLYTKTRLQPDLSIVYTNKEELKQNETEKIVWFSSTRIRVAVAAAVVLFVFTYWLSNDETQSGGAIVAGNFNVNSIQKGVTPNNLTENTSKNLVIETQPKKTGKQNPVSDLSKEPQEKLPIAENEQKNKVPEKITESPSYNQSTELYAQVPTPSPNTENSINPTPSFQNQNTSTGISGMLPSSYQSQKSISASQYLLHRIKKRLDHRKKPVDINEENCEQIAIEDARGENNQHLDGWDIAGSAIGKISAVTGLNMSLKRNSFDGTVLSLGKYSVRLSQKGSN